MPAARREIPTVAERGGEREALEALAERVEAEVGGPSGAGARERASGRAHRLIGDIGLNVGRRRLSTARRLVLGHEQDETTPALRAALTRDD